MAEANQKVRVVRCPKCDKLLPELPNFTLYRCGGCNATLQAKKGSTASEASSEISEGETLKYFVNAEISAERKGTTVASDTGSEVDPKGEKPQLRVEEKKLTLEDSPISGCTLVVTNEDGDGLKEPEASKIDESSIETGMENKETRYRSDSKASVEEKVEEEHGTKVQVDYSSGHRKVQQKKTWRSDDRDRPSVYRRPNPYPNEGPSNYHQSPAKRQNLDGPSSGGYLDPDRAELLRKLDELREQLKRSCEIVENPKERPSVNRTTTFSSIPYARNGQNNWFPESASSLNRTSSRHSPFVHGHGTDIPNLYPMSHSQNVIPGYREVCGPHSLGRAPFHPPSQYSRPMNNCPYGHFDPDPLVSYHHDGFYLQPACSCLHCYNSQRVPYPLNNNGFYQVDGLSVLGPQNYNQRDVNIPLHSNEQRYRRPVNTKKEARTCRPVAGAAPFVSCYNCFELLQLPEDILGARKNRYKLRCGSCSQLISFEYDGRRLLTSVPVPTENLTSEHNNSHMNGHHSNSYSGSFDSTGYDANSADEKLVLPSYPVSSNEMIAKEYGFHMSESEKMHGISSTSSTSEDVESSDSMISQRERPSSTEHPLEAEGVPHVSSLPLREHFGYPSSNQVVDGPGNGSRSRRTEQEKIVSMNGNFKQNSVKDVPVVTEMDSLPDEYPDADFPHDAWEVSNDEDQPKAKNNKGTESFFTGLIKKSFRSMDSGKCKVFINAHPISDRLVKKAEKLAGPVHPGDYWYDYRAGFWGVIGHACLGIIPPFIEEFNYPMPKNCAGGNTGVLVNGRELHHNDLALLVGRGLPPTEGRSYIIEISGKVWDEASGEELDSLGKLAPTIEKVKHGFGMRAPRATS